MNNKNKSKILSSILLIGLLSGCAKINSKSDIQSTEDTTAIESTIVKNDNISDIFDFDIDRSLSSTEYEKEEEQKEVVARDISKWCFKSDYRDYYIVDLEGMFKYYYNKSDEFIKNSDVQHVINKLNSMSLNIYFKKGESDKKSTFTGSLYLYFDPFTDNTIFIVPAQYYIHISFDSLLEENTGESHDLYEINNKIYDATKHYRSYYTKDTRMHFLHYIYSDDETKPRCEIARFYDTDYSHILDIELNYDGIDGHHNIAFKNPDGEVVISLTKEETDALRSIFISYLSQNDYRGFIINNSEIFNKLLSLAKFTCSNELYESLCGSMNSLINERTLSNDKII